MIWIFWVCQLSSAWYNIDCSQLMFQFDCNQLQPVYLTMEHRPARNPQHKSRKPLLTRSMSYSNFSIYYTNLFFLHFSCVFICLKIIKHDMLHMLLIFSIFNIKMAAQNFINFDKLFLKFTLIWQLSQYNLTKLFWMMLNTTKWP